MIPKRQYLSKVRVKMITESISGATYYRVEPSELTWNVESADKSPYREYLRGLSPAGVSRPVEVSLIRDIFAESLPADSTIYGAVDFFRASALFISTLGMGADETAAGLLFRNRFEEAARWDRMTSCMADNLARLIMEKWSMDISDKWDERKYHPTRYSPGYCRWDLSGQVALFGYMAGSDFVVQLKNNGFMAPVKSISGILAIEESDPSGLVRACLLCRDKCRHMRRAATFRR